MSNDEAIALFWRQAQVKGNVNRLEALIGPNVHGTMPPPVWSTSADPVQASADVQSLLSSGTLTQVVAVADLDDAGQGAPHVGDLAIVLDGDEQPKALVRTASVTTEASHPDLPDADGDVVVEGLELLYPRRAKSRAPAST